MQWRWKQKETTYCSSLFPETNHTPNHSHLHNLSREDSPPPPLFLLKPILNLSFSKWTPGSPNPSDTTSKSHSVLLKDRNVIFFFFPKLTWGFWCLWSSDAGENHWSRVWSPRLLVLAACFHLWKVFTFVSFVNHEMGLSFRTQFLLETLTDLKIQKRF